MSPILDTLESFRYRNRTAAPERDIDSDTEAETRPQRFSSRQGYMPAPQASRTLGRERAGHGRRLDRGANVCGATLVGAVENVGFTTCHMRATVARRRGVCLRRLTSGRRRGYGVQAKERRGVRGADK